MRAEFLRSMLLLRAAGVACLSLIGNKGIDLAISATALEHGLTVATRNVSDFEPTGVPVFNPFSARSARKP